MQLIRLEHTGKLQKQRGEVIFVLLIVGPREAHNPSLDSGQWIAYYMCMPRLSPLC